MKRLRVALERRRLDGRTAGHRQAQELGRLIEGFTQRIVDRRREPLVAPDGLDEQKLRMAARNEQHQVRRPQAFGQADCQGVRLEMIDCEKWLAGGERQGLAGRRADNQPADQTGTRCGGDAREVVQPDLRLCQGSADQLIETLGVGTSGNLRNDPAIDRVLVELREHDVG